MTNNDTNRTISSIAFEITKDWSSRGIRGKGVNFAAIPYLSAMRQLYSISDMFGYDSAKSIVLYFLSNAGGYRGETAKRCKAELRAIIA